MTTTATSLPLTESPLQATQAHSLLDAAADARDARSKAIRIQSIRKAIASHTYETDERLDHAVQSLLANLRAFEQDASIGRDGELS